VQSIDFEGTLIVSENLTISYHLLRRTSSTGEVVSAETSLSFGAIYQKNDFTGDLELTLTVNGSTAGRRRFPAPRRRGREASAVGFTFSRCVKPDRIDHVRLYGA
jgi:hypothetical protein